jgi:hypothetical protein
MKVILTITIMSLFQFVLPLPLSYICMVIAVLILATLLIAEREERKDFRIHPAPQHNAHSKHTQVLRKQPSGFRAPSKYLSEKKTHKYDLNTHHLPMIDHADLDSSRPAIESRVRHDLARLEHVPDHRLTGNEDEYEEIPLYLSLPERLKILEHQKKTGVHRPSKPHPIDRLRAPL